MNVTADAHRIAVIGAGIGGPSAAIRLAHSGLSVTLIEAQAGPGGKMRTVPSGAGPVDAGSAVLTMRRVFDDLFAAAGESMEDHLILLPQATLARHCWRDGSRLDLFVDPLRSAAPIAAFAGPKAEDDFIRYHRLTSLLYRAFDAPTLQAGRPRMSGIRWHMLRNPGMWSALLPQITMARPLAHSLADPRLRQLFGRYATYVGGVPDQSPAVLSLIWQAEALARRRWRRISRVGLGGGFRAGMTGLRVFPMASGRMDRRWSWAWMRPWMARSRRSSRRR